MAKQRYINTKFWSDTWISNLDPIEKLLYIYLLTNEKTNIAGIYELPLKIMAVETGIEREMIEKIIKRFKKDKKINYYKGWIYIINFQRHQDTNNAKIRKGIEVIIEELPKKIRVGIGYTYPSNNTNTNNNSNTNNNTNAADKKSAEIQAIINLFQDVNPSYQKLFAYKTQRAAVERMLKVYGRANLENIVKALPEVHKNKYWPKSTTPCRLEDNLPIYKAKSSEKESPIKKKFTSAIII